MRVKKESVQHIVIGIVIAIFAVAQLLKSEQPPSVLSGNSNYGYVTRVVDGDTIELSTGDIVRYIGIDTPELHKTPECGAVEATELNQQLVLNKEVLLVKDVSETDRYGRLLRYVYIGDTFVNATLVQEGFATTATFPPDVAYEQEFRLLQAAAQRDNKGLWGECQQ